jgi:hypothetical protein
MKPMFAKLKTPVSKVHLLSFFSLWAIQTEENPKQQQIGMHHQNYRLDCENDASFASAETTRLHSS